MDRSPRRCVVADTSRSNLNGLARWRLEAHLRLTRTHRTLFVVVAGAFVMANAWGAGPLDQAIAEATKANKASSKSQDKVEKVDDERSDIVAEYRALLEQLESLQRYNAEVSSMVEVQETEMSSIQGKIDQVVGMQRDVVPLMVDMLASLEAFIQLDVPFLIEERAQRVALMKELIKRADVTTAEKFRRLLESFQFENEYGRTIEAYNGKLIGEDKSERTVQFLRIGRVILAYQTLDGNEQGIWNMNENRWEELPADYRTSLNYGFRIAKKQAPPGLIRLPVWVSKGDAK